MSHLVDIHPADGEQGRASMMLSSQTPTALEQLVCDDFTVPIGKPVRLRSAKRRIDSPNDLVITIGIGLAHYAPSLMLRELVQTHEECTFGRKKDRSPIR